MLSRKTNKKTNGFYLVTAYLNLIQILDILLQEQVEQDVSFWHASSTPEQSSKACISLLNSYSGVVDIFLECVLRFVELRYTRK